jgi:uncharacterized protein YcfJ
MGIRKETNRDEILADIEGQNKLNKDVETDRDANPDAITGAPGSHPVGTGIGAATAGAAGAVIGSVVPGVGTAIGGAIGAVVGAVAGGYAGKAVAEAVNPTDEDAYWRAEHHKRDYYDKSYNYDSDYSPAYRTGVELFNEHPGRSYEEVEADARARWETRRGKSRLDWDRASLAMKDVWQRPRNTTGSGTRATGTSGSSERVT